MTARPTDEERWEALRFGPTVSVARELVVQLLTEAGAQAGAKFEGEDVRAAFANMLDELQARGLDELDATPDPDAIRDAWFDRGAL